MIKWWDPWRNLLPTPCSTGTLPSSMNRSCHFFFAFLNINPLRFPRSAFIVFLYFFGLDHFSGFWTKTSIGTFWFAALCNNHNDLLETYERSVLGFKKTRHCEKSKRRVIINTFIMPRAIRGMYSDSESDDCMGSNISLISSFWLPPPPYLYDSISVLVMSWDVLNNTYTHEWLTSEHLVWCIHMNFGFLQLYQINRDKVSSLSAIRPSNPSLWNWMQMPSTHISSRI